METCGGGDRWEQVSTSQVWHRESSSEDEVWVGFGWFNILARIIQESSIALYPLFPATAGASKMKCRRAILSEIGLHSGYNVFLLKAK